jgi:hypothetical protein
MGTLEGFPNPPAMVRSGRSSPLPTRFDGIFVQDVSRNEGESWRQGSVPTLDENAMPSAAEGKFTLTPWPLSQRERGGFGQ